jgi:hypothetical protein
MSEIRIQGNTRLKMKYNVRRRRCKINITKGYLVGQHSYLIASEYDITSSFLLVILKFFIHYNK